MNINRFSVATGSYNFQSVKTTNEKTVHNADVKAVKTTLTNVKNSMRNLNETKNCTHFLSRLVRKDQAKKIKNTLTSISEDAHDLLDKINSSSYKHNSSKESTLKSIIKETTKNLSAINKEIKNIVKEEKKAQFDHEMAMLERKNAAERSERPKRPADYWFHK